MRKSKSKMIVLSAAFASLVAIATALLAFPFPSGIGYFNLGDVIVLLAGWMLGPIYGGLAAAIGSMIADLWLGYAAYAPATFLIKGCVAVVAWGMYVLAKRVIKKPNVDFLPRMMAGVVAELLMVLGYLFFEGVILGLGLAAFVGFPGNALQGACGCLGAVAVESVLYPLPIAKKLFS